MRFLFRWQRLGEERGEGVEALAAVLAQLEGFSVPAGGLVAISAADPPNLTGIIIPGARVPAQPGNRILLRDGVPVAASIAGKFQFLEKLDAAAQWTVRMLVLRKQRAADSQYR